jgi:hypothetical protein
MKAADLSSNFLPVTLDEARALIAAGERSDPMPPPEEAARLAARVIGAYRRSDYADPEIWVALVAKLFASYPGSIARQVATEYPTTHKFPPAVAEIREALEAPLARRRAIVDRARRVLTEHERRETEDARFARIPADARERQVAEALRIIGKIAAEKDASAKPQRAAPQGRQCVPMDDGSQDSARPS